MTASRCVRCFILAAARRSCLAGNKTRLTRDFDAFQAIKKLHGQDLCWRRSFSSNKNRIISKNWCLITLLVQFWGMLIRLWTMSNRGTYSTPIAATINSVHWNPMNRTRYPPSGEPIHGKKQSLGCFARKLNVCRQATTWFNYQRKHKR